MRLMSNVITRAETLPILAEKVMGWPNLAHWVKLYPDTPFCVPGRPNELWNPWEEDNVKQAVDLAEAWCEQQKIKRERFEGGYTHTRYHNGTHGVALFQRYSVETPEVQINAPTLSAALTGAVCKAKGLEVEE